MKTFPRASYEVLEALRVGGLAQSYLTRCVGTQGHARAVLKQLLPSFSDDRGLVERWLHKAEQNAAVSHPGCARVLDWGRGNGEAYLAVEYVEGVGLKHILRVVRSQGERLPLAVAVYIARSALDALACGHGLVPALPHLDVSPYSLIVRPTGQLALTEFGMWDALEPADVARLRFDRGRVNYVSPEQVKSQPAGPASDVFSLGMVLHEMLVGQLPFAGATQLIVAMAIAENKRKPIHELAPSLPNALCEVVEHLLAHRPEDRFQCARAALNALTAVGPLDPSAPEWLAQLAARTVQLGRPSAPPLPGDPPVRGQVAASVHGWTSPAPLPRAGNECPTEQWDVSAMRSASAAVSATSPASATPPPMVSPAASGDFAGPVLPPPWLETAGAVVEGPSAAPEDVERSLPVPPPMLAVPVPSARGVPAPCALTPPALTSPAPALTSPAPALGAPPNPDGLWSPLPQPTASSPPRTPAVGRAPAPVGAAIGAGQGSPPWVSTPPPAPLGMPRPGESVWQEPSKTLFQLKSYAKGATARSTSKTPLWLAVVLATVFGFAAVAGGYLLLLLLR